MKKSVQQPEPHVGIFWLIGQRLIIDTTPLSAAGKYGDFRIHEGDHEAFWGGMERRGEVPRDSDYEEHPRGRVKFDTRTQRFSLYADKCILSRREVVRKIMDAMHLPPDKTTEDRDEHYRCSRCLTRRPSNSTEDE
jgi:hypothetical protein